MPVPADGQHDLSHDVPPFDSAVRIDDVFEGEDEVIARPPTSIDDRHRWVQCFSKSEKES